MMAQGAHMKTNVREMSLLAYHDKVLPRLPECQARVLDVFYEQPGRDFTNQEIAKALNWEICSVTGRVYELREKRILKFNRRRACGETGNTAMVWRMTR